MPFWKFFPSGENTAQEPIANAIRGIVWHEIKGNTAQLCLRAAAVFLPRFFSLKNEKYIQYSFVFQTLN